MKDHPAITRLETLFDQAFEERIADRIGSAKDFIERLLHARAAKGGERKSLNEILKDRSEQIYSSSQTLKLQRYASAAEQVAGAVQQIVSVSSESHFRLVVLSAPNDIPYKVPSDMTALGVGFALCVMVQNLDLNRRCNTHSLQKEHKRHYFAGTQKRQQEPKSWAVGPEAFWGSRRFARGNWLYHIGRHGG